MHKHNPVDTLLMFMQTCWTKVVLLLSFAALELNQKIIVGVEYVHFSYLILSLACLVRHCQKLYPCWVKSLVCPLHPFATLTCGRSSVLFLSLTALRALVPWCWGYVSGSNHHSFSAVSFPGTPQHHLILRQGMLGKLGSHVAHSQRGGLT